MSAPAWHADVLGNATEPLLVLFGLLLLVCTLTGAWWPLGYVLCASALLALATLYAVYLEYNTRTALERRERERLAPGPKGWGSRSNAAASDPGPRRRE